VQFHGDICDAAVISFSRTKAGYKVGWDNNTKSQLKGRAEINTSKIITFVEI